MVLLHRIVQVLALPSFRRFRQRLISFQLSNRRRIGRILSDSGHSGFYGMGGR